MFLGLISGIWHMFPWQCHFCHGLHPPPTQMVKTSIADSLSSYAEIPQKLAQTVPNKFLFTKMLVCPQPFFRSPYPVSHSTLVQQISLHPMLFSRLGLSLHSLHYCPNSGHILFYLGSSHSSSLPTCFYPFLTIVGDSKN